MPTYQSEYLPLKSILLKRPQNAFLDIDGQWEPLNYTGKPELQKAIDEYQYLENAIKSTGSDLSFLDADVDVSLDSIYVRDASITTNKGVILCNMGKGARTVEPEKQEEFYNNQGINILGRIEAPGTVEGGDVAWLNEYTLAVGRGYRTNTSGITQLKKLIGDEVNVLEFHLPHYKGVSDVFHLMSVLSPVDKDLAVVYSPLMPVPLRELLLDLDYNLVEVPDNEFESMGCNVLAIAPRKTIMVRGNPETTNQLTEFGAEVIEYAGDNISLKGCGGPTCLTRPLLRGD